MEPSVVDMQSSSPGPMAGCSTDRKHNGVCAQQPLARQLRVSLKPIDEFVMQKLSVDGRILVLSDESDEYGYRPKADKIFVVSRAKHNSKPPSVVKGSHSTMYHSAPSSVQLLKAKNSSSLYVRRSSSSQHVDISVDKPAGDEDSATRRTRQRAAGEDCAARERTPRVNVRPVAELLSPSASPLVHRMCDDGDGASDVRTDIRLAAYVIPRPYLRNLRSKRLDPWRYANRAILQVGDKFQGNPAYERWSALRAKYWRLKRAAARTHVQGSALHGAADAGRRWPLVDIIDRIMCSHGVQDGTLRGRSAVQLCSLGSRDADCLPSPNRTSVRRTHPPARPKRGSSVGGRSVPTSRGEAGPACRVGPAEWSVLLEEKAQSLRPSEKVRCRLWRLLWQRTGGDRRHLTDGTQLQAAYSQLIADALDALEKGNELRMETAPAIFHGPKSTVRLLERVMKHRSGTQTAKLESESDKIVVTLHSDAMAFSATEETKEERLSTAEASVPQSDDAPPTSSTSRIINATNVRSSSRYATRRRSRRTSVSSGDAASSDSDSDHQPIGALDADSDWEPADPQGYVSVSVSDLADVPMLDAELDPSAGETKQHRTEGKREVCGDDRENVGTTLDGHKEEEQTAKNEEEKVWTRTFEAGLPLEPLKKKKAPRDICAGKDLLRWSGKKCLHRDTKPVWAACHPTYRGAEPPDEAWLFIRCVRCPEVVFTSFSAVEAHCRRSGHCLSCVLCDTLMAPARVALAHLRVSHAAAAPPNWHQFVRCGQCDRTGFQSVTELVSHMEAYRAGATCRDPRQYPGNIVCYARVLCNQCGIMRADHRTDVIFNLNVRTDPPCNHAVSLRQLRCPYCREMQPGLEALISHLAAAEGTRDDGKCQQARGATGSQTMQQRRARKHRTGANSTAVNDNSPTTTVSDSGTTAVSSATDAPHSRQADAPSTTVNIVVSVETDDSRADTTSGANRSAAMAASRGAAAAADADTSAAADAADAADADTGDMPDAADADTSVAADAADAADSASGAIKLPRGCPLCRRPLYAGERLRPHLETHRSPGLRCVQCNLVCTSAEEMRAHRALPWRCVCSSCSFQVGRGGLLIDHVREAHQNGTLLNDTLYAYVKRSRPKDGYCELCKVEVHRLSWHIKQNHTYRFCTCCEKEVTHGTWMNHRTRVRNRDKLECKVCGRVVSTPYALRGHMRRHTGERPYMCDQCGRAFPQRCQLRSHAASAHGVQLSYEGGQRTYDVVQKLRAIRRCVKSTRTQFASGVDEPKRAVKLKARAKTSWCRLPALNGSAVNTAELMTIPGRTVYTDSVPLDAPMATAWDKHLEISPRHSPGTAAANRAAASTAESGRRRRSSAVRLALDPWLVPQLGPGAEEGDSDVDYIP